MRFFNLYSFLLLSLFVLNLNAQVPILINTNQAPSSIDWMEINTEHFQIVYPKEIENKAKYVAQELEYYFPVLKRNLNSPFKKISIVLQTKTTQANAYVAFAPWRSHWVVTPFIGDRLGATEWLKTLSIHEQRHMVQLEKYKQGWSRIFYLIFGETGQALASNWSTPAWLFEGDAVVEETLLTQSGRGRIPDFLNHIRAMLLEDKLPDYDKMFLRSFKDYIPNHYPLGYVMSLHLRTVKDHDLTNETINYSARNAWDPYAFEDAVKYFSHTPFNNFYQQAFKNLKNFYQVRDQSITPSKFISVGKTKEVFEQNNIMGHYKDELLVFKTGLAAVEQFSLFDPQNKKYTRLFRTNGYFGNKVTIKNDQFVFSDLKVHPRFGQEDFSDLFIYDFKEKKKLRITFNERYYLPELSNDGKKILALSFKESFIPELVIMNIKGEVQTKIMLESFELPISLNFDNDQKISLIVKDKNGDFFLKTYDLNNKNFKTLFASQSGTMAQLRKIDEDYYFQGNFDGLDNIYFYDTKTGNLKKITESRYGATNPIIGDDFFYYNDYSLLGNNIVKASPLNEFKPYKLKPYYIDAVLKNETKPVKTEPDTYQKTSLSQKDYKRDLINAHSWDYITSILSPYQILSLKSDDILSEMSWANGVLFHNGEKSLTYFTGLDYQQYWPIFHLRGDMGKRTIFTNFGQENEEVFSWHQNSLNIGFTLPWKNLSDGNLLSAELTGLTGYRYISNKTYPGEEQNGELKTNQFNFNLKYFGEQSPRDLKPVWGVEVKIDREITDTQIGSTPDANIRSTQMALYAPGIFSHNHFFITLGKQTKTIGSYDLADTLPFGRGYSEGSFTELEKATLNYSLPLIYPDLSIFKLIYFKRVRANLFYDHVKTSLNTEFRSYGLEVVFDTNLFRQLFLPLSWGVRSSYLLDDPENDYNHELFLDGEVFTF